MTAKIIVKCIIYNRALNRFLLVQRCENDHTGANTWENAGGNIEDGETPEDAVFREVKEETGITDIEIKKIAYVSILEGELLNLLIVYLCETATRMLRSALNIRLMYGQMRHNAGSFSRRQSSVILKRIMCLIFYRRHKAIPRKRCKRF